MAQFTPYFGFINAKEALAFYEEFFGATDIQRQAIPTQELAEQLEYTGNLEDSTAFASFVVEGQKCICTDRFLYREDEFSRQMSMQFNYAVTDENIKHVSELCAQIEKSEDVSVSMSFQANPMGGYMAQYVDKFGISWIFAVMGE